MMVVTAPVLPPTFEPDSNYSSPARASPSTSSIPFPVFPHAFASSSSPQQPRTMPKLDDEVLKSSLPPTPEPSPPTKILFPVQMVALAPPADDTPFRDQRRGSTPSSSGSSPSTNASVGRPVVEATHSDLLSPSPPKPYGLARSDTQPSLSRSSTGRIHKEHKEKEAERTSDRWNRPKASRRSTFAAPTGPSSVRMTETRSADSRTRLRSGGPKLTRYPTLATEYPTAVSRARREGQASSSATPPRSFPTSTPVTEFDDLDFGGPEGLEAKVVLLGSQGVGKTSLILRLTTGSYSSIPAPASLDGSLYKRKLVHNGVPIKLQIWDTAGQERFRSMAPIYYRGAHVCILVYDITDRESFNDVRSWLEELNGKASKDMIICVVGAKLDLERQRAVTFGEARRTVRSWLKPPPPEPEDTETLTLPSRSLFRSASSRSRRDSMTGPSPTVPRTRPHSMHGLASLMAAAADFADFDLPSGVSSPRPSLVSPTPTPTVHFPVTLSGTSSSAGASSVSASTIASPQSAATSITARRAHRVSFHGPVAAQPTFGTTAETAVASTANSHVRQRQSSNRFSMSGMFGLTRSPDISEAVATLSDLAEASSLPPRVATPRANLSPTSPARTRTESSPLLSHAHPRGEEWSRGWGRGEGPSAADALEEFGQVVRQENMERTNMERTASVPPRTRARGGSLGRDARLYGTVETEDEREKAEWGVLVEGVRLGEVSSLTGEGVEAMCRAISNVLVERKDKIERERTLRRKDSVMLTTAKASSPKAKGRGGCC